MVTEKDVKYIADLSRIYLKESEVHQLTKNLEEVLNYIKKLEQLDTSDVNPTTHVLPLKNIYRKDEAQASFSQKEALKIAVEQHSGCFKVPKVIE